MKQLFGICLCLMLFFCAMPTELSAQTLPADKTYTIVINPGHSSAPLSGKEPIAPGSSTLKPKGVYGATGSFTKVPEYRTTVSVGLRLQDELLNRGYNVIMTKTTEAQTLSNIDRAKIGNDNHADLVISIHADSATSSSANGATMLVPANGCNSAEICSVSKEYGTTILSEYISVVGLKSRGLSYRADITGFNWSTVPTVLIEMGFLSNSSDDHYVSNTANHGTIARGLANGIEAALPLGGVFPDVRNHWAKDAILAFAEKGYVSGYENGRFKPNNSITRAEFVRIFNTYFALTTTSGKVFADAQNHWAKKEIDIAVTNGVCVGRSETDFAPNAPITRQEAAMMVANYKKLQEGDLEKLASFQDGNTVAPWAKASLAQVLKSGYLKGYDDNTIRPLREITRGETVVFLGQIPQ